MIVQVQIANFVSIYAIKSWIRKKKELISILLLKLDNKRYDGILIFSKFSLQW